MSIVDPHEIYHRIYRPERAPTKGAPVVLLHGLMGFAANWGKIWPALHKDREVLVLDQRGHGKSPKPATGYSPTDYATDLASLLNHLGWGPCHIVGHSMGGRVALRFASMHPAQTLSLCMEDSGVLPRPERLTWIQGLLNRIPAPFNDRVEARDFFEREFIRDPMVGFFLHANIEEKSNGTLDWRFLKPAMIETIEKGRMTDAMAEFTSLDKPTLLVRGGKSAEFPEEEANAMVAARSGVELVTIPGAGHFVHAEKPQEFSAALASFLERNDP